jgi:anti-anti-sigma factor
MIYHSMVQGYSHMPDPIGRSTVNDIVILSIPQAFTLTGSHEFLPMIRSDLADGKRLFVLNFAQTDFVDSMGFGWLVAAYTAIKNNKGELVLVGVSGRMQQQLKLNRLGPMFRYVDTNDEAVKAFGGGQVRGQDALDAQ